MKWWKAIIIIIIITTIIFLPNNRAAQNFINIAWRDAGAIRGKMTAFLQRRRLTDVQEQQRRVSGAKPSPRYPSRSLLLSCASCLPFLLRIGELNKLQLSCGDSQRLLVQQPDVDSPRRDSAATPRSLQAAAPPPYVVFPLCPSGSREPTV